MVPLPMNINAEDVAKIAGEAEVKCLVCSTAELATLTPVLASIETLRAFVVMDMPPSQDAATEQAIAKVFVCGDLSCLHADHGSGDGRAHEHACVPGCAGEGRPAAGVRVLHPGGAHHAGQARGQCARDGDPRQGRLPGEPPVGAAVHVWQHRPAQGRHADREDLVRPLQHWSSIPRTLRCGCMGRNSTGWSMQ